MKLNGGSWTQAAGHGDACLETARLPAPDLKRGADGDARLTFADARRVLDQARARRRGTGRAYLRRSL